MAGLLWPAYYGFEKFEISIKLQTKMLSALQIYFVLLLYCWQIKILLLRIPDQESVWYHS